MSNVCVRNHQDNHILINVACRSDANMIKWQSASIFVVEDDLKLFCDVFH